MAEGVAGIGIGELATYHNFINSIKSQVTRDRYVYCLKRYVKYLKEDEHHLLQQDAKIVESNIIKYVVWLKKGSKVICYYNQPIPCRSPTLLRNE